VGGGTYGLLLLVGTFLEGGRVGGCIFGTFLEGGKVGGCIFGLLLVAFEIFGLCGACVVAEGTLTWFGLLVGTVKRGGKGVEGTVIE